MKKIKNRAFSALLLAALVVCGLGIFVFRYFTDGSTWVMFSANQNLYHNGVLKTGTVYDRGGLVLASSGEDGYFYAEDAAVRTACLHAVGDYEGNIGTGAVTAFADLLVSYSPLGGVGSAEETELHLTIDSAVSTAAYGALAGRKGAVAVYDYTNGDIICLVSSPSYDPLNVPDLTGENYEGVYLNRCVSSVYTPGSVFKIVTMAAAVENIEDLYSRSFWCSGSVDVAGVTINCSGTHGSQTVEQAFANSCNCAFAELTLELGGDTIEEYARRLGLLDQLSYDGIPTAAGRYDKDVDGSPGLAWSGIGQYNDLVCPFAMMRLAGAIAGGGSTPEPHILLDSSSDSAKLLSESTAQALHDFMSYNAQYAYGRDWSFPGLDICAKSGTAEVGDGTSHAWFVGFLDDPEHPYAFAVIVEHGGGGLSVAGSVANTVLQAAVQ